MAQVIWLQRFHSSALETILSMGKGIPVKARRAGDQMPFKTKPTPRKPSTWKQKQQVCINAGLRAMSAPWAGLSMKSLR